ncbi:MAG TPA: hypothetical protein VLA56_11245 [Pseudomonadales bacterium]|nr:hypothetical protein [Pseudomonadales bacterium]
MQTFMDPDDAARADYAAATRHRRAGLADTCLIVLDGTGMAS